MPSNCTKMKYCSPDVPWEEAQKLMVIKLSKKWHTRIAGMDCWDGPGLGLGNGRFIGVMSSTKLSQCLARFPMGYLFQNVSVNNVPSWHTC